MKKFIDNAVGFIFVGVLIMADVIYGDWGIMSSLFKMVRDIYFSVTGGQ